MIKRVCFTNKRESSKMVDYVHSRPIDAIVRKIDSLEVKSKKEA